MTGVKRLVLLLLWLPLAAVAGNALEGHPSPYLALHGNDPVEWRDWGEPALREAREQKRPLFVSIRGSTQSTGLLNAANTCEHTPTNRMLARFL